METNKQYKLTDLSLLFYDHVDLIDRATMQETPKRSSADRRDRVATCSSFETWHTYLCDRLLLIEEDL